MEIVCPCRRELKNEVRGSFGSPSPSESESESLESLETVEESESESESSEEEPSPSSEEEALSSSSSAFDEGAVAAFFAAALAFARRFCSNTPRPRFYNE